MAVLYVVRFQKLLVVVYNGYVGKIQINPNIIVVLTGILYGRLQGGGKKYGQKVRFLKSCPHYLNPIKYVEIFEVIDDRKLVRWEEYKTSPSANLIWRLHRAYRPFLR